MTSEEAIKIIKDGRIGVELIRANDEETTKYNLENIEALNMAIKALEKESKTGHWIAVENEEMETVGYYCSECDLPMETEQRTNFCPNCGAKMRGEQ